MEGVALCQTDPSGRLEGNEIEDRHCTYVLSEKCLKIRISDENKRKTPLETM